MIHNADIHHHISDWDQRRCYICGEYGADSGDHIPPKGVLPKEYRHLGNDLIQVPAHTTCNKEQESDDEYFISQIGLLALKEGEQGNALWQQVHRGLKRKESLGLTKKIYQEFIDGGVAVPHASDLPEIIPKKVEGERILRVVSRTARGIYYYRTRQILPPDWPIRPSYMEPQEKALAFLDQKFGLDNFDSFAQGSFIYIWLPWQKSERDGVFSFIFFNKVCFSVFLGSVAKTRNDAV